MASSTAAPSRHASARSISPAAARTWGSTSRRRARPSRNVGPLSPMTPARSPSGEWTGTEIDARPDSSSSTSSAQRCRRTRSSSARSSSGAVIVRLVYDVSGPEASHSVELLRVEVGQDELSGRRGVEGYLCAHPVGDTDMTLGVELEEDLHPGPSPWNGEQRGLPRVVAEPGERGVGGVHETPVRIGLTSESDQLVAQDPASARLLDEAEVGKRPERPRDGGAGNGRGTRELGRRQRSRLRTNGTKQQRGASERLRPRRTCSAHYMSRVAHIMSML